MICSVSDPEKIQKEEAQNKGLAIITNLAEMHDLIEWDDVEDAFLNMKFHQSGRVEIFTSKDKAEGNAPTTFDLKEVIRKPKMEL